MAKQEIAILKGFPKLNAADLVELFTNIKTFAEAVSQPFRVEIFVCLITQGSAPARATLGWR
jgi:hypothetical protein